MTKLTMPRDTSRVLCHIAVSDFYLTFITITSEIHRKEDPDFLASNRLVF